MEYLLYDDKLEISVGVILYSGLVCDIRKAIEDEYDVSVRCTKFGEIRISFLNNTKLTDDDTIVIENIIFDMLENNKEVNNGKI